MDRPVENAACILREKGIGAVDIGIVLGSGLGEYGWGLPVQIAYSDIEGFPRTTVPGHVGCLRYGEKYGKKVLCFSGRFHAYEGHSKQNVTFLIHLLKALGAPVVLLTCAVGGIRGDLRPGDLLMISDHINFGENPLWGPNDDDIGPRFFDMTQAYDRELQQVASAAADKIGVSLKSGVYAYMRGPCYETPAEIRALRTLGGDVVGMSTVQEVIAARHAGIRVLGIAVVTNYAAGISSQPLNHQEVVETGNRVRNDFSALLDSVLETL